MKSIITQISRINRSILQTGLSSSVSILITFLLLSLPFLSLPLRADNNDNLVKTDSIPSDKPDWELIAHNLYFGKISLSGDSPILKSDLYLLKFEPKYFIIEIAISKQLVNEPATDLKNLVKKSSAIAGINASFFDKQKKPLGLIINSDGSRHGTLQLGGKLLTGIFQIKEGIPSIIYRGDYTPDHTGLAIQAGPRLIANKVLTSFSDDEPYSRRSGIAIASTGEIILFATAVRFPGARMKDIQIALLNVGIPILDALNFDGGGSSQLYAERTNSDKEEIFVSGGDNIPVALVIKEK